MPNLKQTIKGFDVYDWTIIGCVIVFATCVIALVVNIGPLLWKS